MLAWRAFFAELDAGDINSAQQFISQSSRTRYVAGLTNLGLAITTTTTNWSAPRKVTKYADFAVYAVTESQGADSELHLVFFYNESNKWFSNDF
jgi:hypothetical protein